MRRLVDLEVLTVVHGKFTINPEYKAARDHAGTELIGFVVTKVREVPQTF